MSVGSLDFLPGAPRIRTWALLLLLHCTGCLAGIVRTDRSISAVLGVDVTLKCFYEAQDGETVSQAAWFKKSSNGQVIQMAIMNAQLGTYLYGEYEKRLTQVAPLNPKNSTIVLKNAVQADEGVYQCRVNTFPAGTFEAEVQLKVLVPPLPTLNPGPRLVEGVGQTLAASCTAEGNPAPGLSWETQVTGSNTTRTAIHQRSASVTSEFYVVPARSMNGKALTCVIAHPGFREEKRVTHLLSVMYLAEASVHDGDGWFVGKEDALLQCECQGNPTPVYTWSRVNGSLPSNAKSDGNRLVFAGALSGGDAGTYLCQAANDVGTRQATISVSIAEHEPRKVDVVSLSLVAVAVVTAILLVILVVIVLLVNRHHKRKTKRLSEKIEELSTLSRQTSRRRLSTSASTDTRMQLEESLHLRLHPDSLRDPSLCSMMGEEADRRSYSTLTTVRENETQTELLSTVPDEEVKEEEEEEEEMMMADKERERSEQGSTGLIGTQPFIQQGMTHFYQENGTLRAKPTTHSIYINGRGHLV
ncbi:nectin-4 [Gastrophryne carolinensis]